MPRIVALFAAALIALPAVLAGAALPEAAAVEAGARFIITTQQPDGGFGGFGPTQSWDAVYALRAAGYDPSAITTAGQSPADFLEGLAPSLETDTAANISKAVLAAQAMNIDPSDVAGVDLLSALEASWVPGSGAEPGNYGANDIFVNGPVVLALGCVGGDLPDGVVASILASQYDDGGWGFGASDPDGTPIGIQALIAAGVAGDAPQVAAAVEWLRANQNADGGWGYGGVSNVNSTAYAIQGLLAAGEDVESAAWTKGGATPVSYIVSQQEADGGFPGFDRAFAANQAVPALAGLTMCESTSAAITKAPPTPTPTVPTTPSPTATVTTPSSTATGTATATVTRTATAPGAPNTGNSAGTGSGGSAPWLPVVLGATLLALGAAAALARRRSRA